MGKVNTKKLGKKVGKKLSKNRSVPSTYANGKRRQVPQWMRKRCWKRLYGKSKTALCGCCEKAVLVRKEKNGWHAAHKLAHSRNGRLRAKNLIPTCSDCNWAMGNEYYYDYKERMFRDTMDADQLWLNHERAKILLEGRKLGVWLDI